MAQGSAKNTVTLVDRLGHPIEVRARNGVYVLLTTADASDKLLQAILLELKATNELLAQLVKG